MKQFKYLQVLHKGKFSVEISNSIRVCKYVVACIITLRLYFIVQIIMF
jgi:hypothetical protein